MLTANPLSPIHCSARIATMPCSARNHHPPLTSSHAQPTTHPPPAYKNQLMRYLCPCVEMSNSPREAALQASSRIRQEIDTFPLSISCPFLHQRLRLAISSSVVPLVTSS